MNIRCEKNIIRLICVLLMVHSDGSDGSRTVTPSEYFLQEKRISPSFYLCQNPEHYLTRRQQELCKNDRYSFAASLQGVKRAEYECKNRFANERWNCPELFVQLQNSLHESKNPTKTIFMSPTKETAYANALVAASITHAVSKACQQGMIPEMECQASNENEYDTKTLTTAQRRQANELAKKGLKPPDNRQTKIECIFECQEHGFSISKEYLERDDREEINFNNQEVGRKINDDTTNNCKCHGISGSCTVTTCFPKSLKYDTMARKIFRAYKDARRYDGWSGEVDPNLGQHEELLYTKDHDYCSASENANIGFPGTKDRPCRPGRKGSGKGRPGKKGRSRRDRRRDRKKTRRNRRDKKENDTSEKQLPKCGRKVSGKRSSGKKEICCGRGYHIIEKQVKKTRNCKFFWCCRIECEEIVETVKQGVCN